MTDKTELTALAGQSQFDHPLGGLAHALTRFGTAVAACDLFHTEFPNATDPPNDLLWARDDEGVEVARILAALLDDGWELTKP
jgi:hypothetical protein